MRRRGTPVRMTLRPVDAAHTITRPRLACDLRYRPHGVFPALPESRPCAAGTKVSEPPMIDASDRGRQRTAAAGSLDLDAGPEHTRALLGADERRPASGEAGWRVLAEAAMPARFVGAQIRVRAGTGECVAHESGGTGSGWPRCGGPLVELPIITARTTFHSQTGLLENQQFIDSTSVSREGRR